MIRFIEIICGLAMLIVFTYNFFKMWVYK
jgi:hypothetical protein